MTPALARDLFDGLMLGGILSLIVPIVSYHIRQARAVRQARREMARL